MSHKFYFILILIVTLLETNVAYSDTLDVQQIMLRSDAASKVIDSRSNLTMTLINAEGEQRVRKLIYRNYSA